MKKTCPVCGVSHIKLYAWQGRKCIDCCRLQRKKYSRKHGTTNRDGITEPVNKKGRDAELLVEQEFKKLGFYTSTTDYIGPDLTVDNGFGVFTIEVKALTNRTDARGCYFVGEVQPNRKKDDLVALVLLEEKRIVFQDMKYHLSRCDRGGKRSVTGLFRKRSWVGAEECSIEDKLIAQKKIAMATFKHGKYGNKFNLGQS